MDMAMALKLHATGHSQTSSSKRANERDKSRSKCDDQYTGLNKFAQIEAQFRWEIFRSSHSVTFEIAAERLSCSFGTTETGNISFTWPRMSFRHAASVIHGAFSSSITRNKYHSTPVGNISKPSFLANSINNPAVNQRFTVRRNEKGGAKPIWGNLKKVFTKILLSWHTSVSSRTRTSFNSRSNKSEHVFTLRGNVLRLFLFLSSNARFMTFLARSIYTFAFTLRIPHCYL